MAELIRRAEDGGCPVAVTGLQPVHRSCVGAAVAKGCGRPAVFVCGDEQEARRLAADLRCLTGAEPVLLLSREWQFRAGAVSSREWERSRLAALYALAKGKAPVTVATADGLMARTAPKRQLLSAVRTLKLGEREDLSRLPEWMLSSGYVRCEQVEGVGQFALRGGILDVFAPLMEQPVRCEFFDDEIDSMNSFYTEQGKELDWNTELSGEKLGDYVKKQALTTSVLYAVIESWAEKYGCTVTDEDRSGINTEWETKAKQYGGEEAYLAVLANLGLDQASAEQLSEDYYLYKHLYGVYSDTSGKLHPDDATLNAYASDNSYLTVDEILISTSGVAKDDTAALKEKRERAEMILSKLSASSNPLEYFTTLAGTYSDDNRDDYPSGFTFSAGSGTMAVSK